MRLNCKPGLDVLLFAALFRKFDFMTSLH